MTRPGLFPVRDGQILEIIRTLNGSGSRLGMEHAAVRLGDFDSLAGIDLTQQSSKVSAPPTAAEFNALVDDVQRIMELLQGVKLAIQKRRNGGTL